MLHFTPADLDGLFDEEENISLGERSPAKASNEPRRAADTIGTAATAVDDAVVIEHLSSESDGRTDGPGGGGSGGSSIETETEPGPADAQVAGARRRSTLVDASNAYRNHAVEPSRMRKKSLSLEEAAEAADVAPSTGEPSVTMVEDPGIDQGGSHGVAGGSRYRDSVGSVGVGEGGREGEGDGYSGEGRRPRARKSKGPGLIVLNASQVWRARQEEERQGVVSVFLHVLWCCDRRVRLEQRDANFGG